MMFRILSTFVLVAACLGILPGKMVLADNADSVLVFAAASLTKPLESISRQYKNLTKTKVRLSFAASSSLARQIVQGAPADIFISANKAWMNYAAEEASLETNTTMIIAANRLVLAAPQKIFTPYMLMDDTTLSGVLKTGRLAMADPDHVPLGLYGRQALRHLGLWDYAAPRLARTVNARATVALLERDETPAGIIYHSDARQSANLHVLYHVPAVSHDPINYLAAIVRGKDRPAVRQFLIALQSQVAKAIFSHDGFVVD
jgi:molybdate transport system substrate-binding protein